MTACIKIAVTGGIASGKSLAGSCLASMGVAVCDADELGHALLREDPEVVNAVLQAFGRGILGAGGRIDRAKLAGKVFADPALRARLNALMHPPIRERWQAWLAAHGEEPAAAVIVPLLFEAALVGRGWDAIICVAAPRSRRQGWLRARGLTDREIAARLEAQMPTREKIVRSDFVIMNNWSEAVLKEQVRRVLRRIVEK